MIGYVESTCCTCLSTDRRLLPLKLHETEIQNWILFDIMDDANVCWECDAILKRIHSFKMQAIKASNLLHNIKKKKNMAFTTLSSLKCVRNRQYDYVYNDVLKQEERDDDSVDVVKNETYGQEVCNDSLKSQIDSCSKNKNNYSNIVIVESEGNIDNSIKKCISNVGNTERECKENNAIVDKICLNKYVTQLPTENCSNVEKECKLLDEAEYYSDNDDFDNRLSSTQITTCKKYGKQKYVKYCAIEKNNIKSNVRKKKMLVIDPKTKLSCCYRRISIKEQEIAKFLAKERHNAILLSKPYQCRECLYGFTNIQSLEKHKEKFHIHLENSYLCDICHSNFVSAEIKVKHWKNHFFIYVCVICNYQCMGEWILKEHILSSHDPCYMCKICQLYFSNRQDFGSHYKQLHSHLLCDYCDKRFLKKSSIESHIKRNHTPLTCSLCGRHYGTYHSLENHYRRCHPHMIVKDVKMEDAYCVECDKQFTSVYKYKNHLRTSVRHSAPKKIIVPCPKCEKVFTRTTYMNNHLHLAHANKSKHYCDICDKYYITAFSLRQHKQLVHEKIAQPKNKICKMCGKGFSTNRILVNHIRTHTGERPYHCTSCPVSFSQKKTLMAHIKNVHTNK